MDFWDTVLLICCFRILEEIIAFILRTFTLGKEK